MAEVVAEDSVDLSMKESSMKQRITYLDILRIIAIILVLFNHTGTNGYLYFTHTQGSFFYPFYLFISLFDKIAVPLFFMISGALLIPKEESYKDVIKRFIKISFVLLFASAVIYVYRYLRGLSSIFTLGEFVTGLWSKGVILQYWYLYTYLAYLLMLPFIRKIAHGLDEKDFIWLMIMLTLNSLFILADYTIFKGKYFHNSDFSLFIGINYVFYPILGYYLEHKLPKERYNWKTLLILVVSSVISLAIMTLLSHMRCAAFQSWTEENIPFRRCFVFLPAMTVFVAAKMWFMKHPLKPTGQKVLASIAGTTFGLYLFEEIFRRELGFVLEAMQTVIHPYIACWIWVFIVCILGGGIIFLIRLIPGVKRVI